MKIRAVKLDVDWAISGPSIVDVAQAIDAVPGVQGANVTITEIDLQTIGSDVSVEGEDIDLAALTDAIEQSGAVVHSIDQLIFGERSVSYEPRRR